MIVQKQKIVLNSYEVVSKSKFHWFNKKETFLLEHFPGLLASSITSKQSSLAA